MSKWLAGIFGTILAGGLLWVLTNTVFPRWFAKSPPLPGNDVRVECTANPSTVAPGASTEVTVKVIRNGTPLEGAAVSLSVGGGLFTSNTTTATGTTYSGGVFRITWRAPSPSASGYVFPAVVDLAGIRTAEGELQGEFRTNCEILVSP